MSSCPPADSNYDPGFCMGTPPNQVYERCVYLEAKPTDQGQHKATYAYWWLACDLWYSLLADPANPISTNAQPNVPYYLNVRVHIAPDCPLPLHASAVKVELYLCQPGLVFPPTPVNQNQYKIFTLPDIPLNDILKTGESLERIQWTPSGNIGAPDGPGHHCLVARCYPSDGHGRPADVRPDQSDFYLPAEPHVAQHNLNVDLLSQNSRQEGPFRFDLQTVNLNKTQPVPVVVRVVTDPRPDQQVLDVLTPQLQQIPGFKRITSVAPTKGFGLQLPDFPDARVQDNTRLFGLFGSGFLGILWRLLLTLILSVLGIFGFKYEPKYEAQIHMQSGQLTTLTFTTDLSNAQLGDAYVFHVTHIEDNVVKGGNTIVAVIV